MVRPFRSRGFLLVLVGLLLPALVQGASATPRTIAPEFAGNLDVVVSFDTDSLQVDPPEDVFVSLTVTPSGAPIQWFEYIGFWTLQGPYGTLDTGQLTGTTFSAETVLVIRIEALDVPAAILYANILLFSGEEMGAGDDAVVLYSSTSSLGLFELKLEPSETSVNATSSTFVTSHARSLFGEALANVLLFYFSLGGVTAPSIGVSDDHGDDRFLFLPFRCSLPEALIFALGISEENGVAFGFTAISVENRDCRSERRARAHAELESVRENQTYRELRLYITITSIDLPPPPGSSNVSLELASDDQSGVVIAKEYIGYGSWIVDYRTEMLGGQITFVIFGHVGMDEFLEVQTIELPEPRGPVVTGDSWVVGGLIVSTVVAAGLAVAFLILWLRARAMLVAAGVI